MVFEIVERGMSKVSLSEDKVSICMNGIVIGKNVSKLFTEKFCEVYFDREAGRIGFKPTSDGVKGFRITPDDKERKFIHIKMKNRVAKTRQNVIQENGLIVVENCEFL